MQLEHCPWCGTNHTLIPDAAGRYQQIVCGACGARGPEVYRVLPYAIAVESWNARQAPCEVNETHRPDGVDDAGDLSWGRRERVIAEGKAQLAALDASPVAATQDARDDAAAWKKLAQSALELARVGASIEEIEKLIAESEQAKGDGNAQR